MAKLWSVPSSVGVTPDGSYLTFVTEQDLTSFDSGGLTQVYRYSAKDDTITCLSCNRDGHRPLGEADFRTDINIAGLPSPPRITRITDDGSRVVFQTADALVPRDDNGAMDVYEWHDGVVNLISDGHANRGSYYFDSSADVSTIFISTAAKLVAADSDNGDQDLYAVRIDGGFPESTKPVDGCVADLCQGMPNVSSPAPVIGSTIFAGSGDADGRASSAAPVSVARPKAVTGSVATLKVKVAAAGAVTVIGGSVRKATKRAGKAATYSMKVSLTAKAKAKLKHVKTLKAAVTVAFKPASGTPASTKATLIFKQPKVKSAARSSDARRGADRMSSRTSDPVPRRLAGLMLLTAAVMVLLLAGAVAQARADFGLTNFRAAALNVAGAEETQAGAHPFKAITSFSMPTEINGGPYPEEALKTALADLPRGFVGAPAAIPQCARAALVYNECPPSTQIGVFSYTTVMFGSVVTRTTYGIYNMVPRTGELADLGFVILGAPIHITLGLRPDKGYSVRAVPSNVSQATPIRDLQVTLWGVPADPSHDVYRGSGYQCYADQDAPEMRRSGQPPRLLAGWRQQRQRRAGRAAGQPVVVRSAADHRHRGGGPGRIPAIGSLRRTRPTRARRAVTG